MTKKKKTKSQIGKASKNKGKVGEREVAKLIQSHGFSAKRGVQFQGGEDSPDVVSSLPCHIEVKRTETLSLYKAMEQAIEDSKGSEEFPTVWHRRNGQEWLVILNANDFLELLKKIIDVEEI